MQWLLRGVVDVDVNAQRSEQGRAAAASGCVHRTSLDCRDTS